MTFKKKADFALAIIVVIVVGTGYGVRRLLLDSETTPLSLFDGASLIQLIVGTLVGLVCALVFRRRFLAPLARLASRVAEMRNVETADGGLALGSEDELGSLANELDRTMRRFRGEIQEGMREQQRREKALTDDGRRYVLAVQATKDGLWDWDLKSDKVLCSARLRAMLGSPNQEMVTSSQEFFELIHPDDREGFRTSLKQSLDSHVEEFCREFRMQRQDKEFLWVMGRGIMTYNQRGKAERLVGLITGITAQKEREEQLAHDAMHDTLTGLANRALLTHQLGLATKRVKRRPRYNFSLLFLDLDRFKVINDGLGHLVGDRLLKNVAERIRASVRGTDTIGRCDSTVARLGGDEFVVLLDDVYDIRDAVRVAERIQSAVGAPLNIDGHEIYTSASIGIAMGEEENQSGEEILRNADTALYQAKANGKGCYAIFDLAMGALAKKRMQLETSLRNATERNELVLYYHPIVSLTTGKIECFEALVRWNHPELGLLSPDQFIPIAEEIDMIQTIGRWILRTACGQTRAWQRGIPNAERLGISVNLSAKEFSQEHLVENIQACLVQTGLDPHCLRIELTESVLMTRADAVVNRLNRLRAEAVQLSIDDFGTGFSSLSYLTHFPMDNVKIDLSFIREMHVSRESQQLVESILALSQSLNLAVVAEGIEEHHQLDRLRELGCEYGQGYFFAKPLTTPAATELLSVDPTW
ncbi:MAG: EAL domain-containing protein [Candidatus Hydrogenedentes bacterium]|nr:EAL domain-containing protein [Candidatus Hydrogenedentota bacterium]